MVKIDNKQRLIAALDSSNYQLDRFGSYTLKISDTRISRIKLKKTSFSYDIKTKGTRWVKVKSSYYKNMLIIDGNVTGLNMAGFSVGDQSTLVL
jgi:hypothetical protein